MDRKLFSSPFEWRNRNLNRKSTFKVIKEKPQKRPAGHQKIF